MQKIDLIIDALETSKPINQESSIPFDKHLKALAVARELRELEPVGVCVEATRYSQNDVDWYSYTPDAGTKLYALGDEK